MKEERRRAISTPGERDPASRHGRTVALSVVIHVLAIAALVRILLIPNDYWRGLLEPGAAKPRQERLDFMRLPSSTDAPRAGGDNRPLAAHPSPAPAPIVAPPTVPSTLPPPPKGVLAPDSGGTGPVVGAGGPTRGVTPRFDDARVWAPATPPGALPLPPKQKLDSAIAARVHELQDSLAAFGPGEHTPGDWTFNKNGKKYGIDPKYIHLGDFSLPTAVLALLPLNVSANPTAIERERRLSMLRGEIQEQAARQVRDEEFREAVKRLRERKDKERAESKKTTVDTTIATSTKP